MANSVGKWLASNWYSIVGLALLCGTFYTTTQKTEWRVGQLEQRATATEAKTEQLSKAITDLTRTVDRTNVILERLEQTWTTGGKR